MVHLAILANENPADHLLWVKACEQHPLEIDYRIVCFRGNNWLKDITRPPVDCLLAKPGGTVGRFKQLYDERLQILVNDLHYRVYPSLNEILIYENKRYLSYWLSANHIPHPETFVFYHENEALEFIRLADFPVVAKLNIGASGQGVQILKGKQDAEQYIRKIFSRGIHAKTGPRLDIGNLWQRAFQKLAHPAELMAKLSVYRAIEANPQTGFCLFQKFIPHTYEWRVVRIGDSYFAHKKIVSDEKASGALIKKYEDPPRSLLDFVRNITDHAGFRSQAMDIFETPEDSYLVNEMQCIFGQSDPYQMLINGKPGRYVYLDNRWVFEEGIYNTNESYDLRIQDILQLLNADLK